MKKKSTKNNRKTILVIVLLFVVIFAFVGGIVYYQVSRTPKAKNTAGTALSDKAGSVDAKAYYTENSQKVISVTPAEASEKVYSEKAVGEVLSSRGFGGKYPITYEYNMDGSTEGQTGIDKASSTVHPQYTVTYVSKSGDYWTVSVCNDCVSAYPVTYNLEHNSGAEVIFTESGSVTSYDSKENCFFETIPKQSVLVMKHIPAITAEALEELTAQEIEKR